MLPRLDNAQPTLHNLSAVSRLLGVVRQLAFEKQPNYLHLGIKVVQDGLSTDILPNGGEVVLVVAVPTLTYFPAEGVTQRIELEGQTQAELLETLLATIYAKELANIFVRAEGESYADAMFKGAEQLVNHGKPSRKHTTGSEPLHFDTEAARHYQDTLKTIFNAMAHFHARLYGTMTPLVVWSEHFDLSFLWFAEQPDESHPHLSFGFAPYSDGIDEPYLYAYAYPYPAEYAPPALPQGARWHTEGWTGVVLPYREMQRQRDPQAFIEASLLAIYKALRPLLE